MAQAAYGISNSKMGPAGANGAMGTSLVDITKIVADSVQVTFPEPTTTDIIAEEEDNPFVVLSTPGKKTIVLKSHDVAPTNLVRAFGGAVTTATGVDTFTPGVQYVIPEQSFLFTTRPLQGKTQTWKFPRCQVYVSLDTNPSKTNTLQLTFTINVLQPYDSGGVPLPDFIVTDQAG